MNTNRERIIQYIAELMNESERVLFSRELESSEELKAQYDSVKLDLEKFSIGKIEADERYFSNLLPSVRSKVEKPVKNKLLPRLAFAIPTLVVVVIAIILIQPKYNSSSSNLEIVNEIIENLDDEIISSKYISDLELDVSRYYKTFASITENNEVVLDESTKNRILTVYDYPLNDELLSAQSLTKEELENIYSKIQTKNY
ncbi:MAG: hypothetical protein WCZ90_13845 [Melioribacteraceae bacterium]